MRRPLYIVKEALLDSRNSGIQVGCAMRTMNQPLACNFRCAQRTLLWVFELIRASLMYQGIDYEKKTEEITTTVKPLRIQVSRLMRKYGD